MVVKRNLSSKVLSKIKASTAFISAAKNSPKHPAKKVTNALKKHGTKVLLNDWESLFNMVTMPLIDLIGAWHQKNLFIIRWKNKYISDVLEILIFDVGQGQCIFFFPRNNPQYGMLVDCASGQEYEPIDFLIRQGFIFHDGNKYVLNNLTITNYDHDHFSGLPKIRQNLI